VESRSRNFNWTENAVQNAGIICINRNTFDGRLAVCAYPVVYAAQADGTVSCVRAIGRVIARLEEV